MSSLPELSVSVQQFTVLHVLAVDRRSSRKACKIAGSRSAIYVQQVKIANGRSAVFLYYLSSE